MEITSKSLDVKKLADYQAIKKLAEALWQQSPGLHGAAIMVGAGFSRTAALTGDAQKQLPLWGDLSSILAADLNAFTHHDPLRLAEEYCAYFGKRALHDLVKREVNDSIWSPGELYGSLLKLPWTAVLTTNWDTLLERAAADLHQRVYSIVYRQEELASARSPRIVKLHGTVGITEDLVFTQEDYRKYPQRHAAFVNLARQVFIENELCLLGFSGDDPNFLQWAGWVRDHLENARRIYLVGVLNLTSAKRKYLESLNVAPIDLADLVSSYDDHNHKHLLAINAFLQELTNLRPKRLWEWEPTELSRLVEWTEDAFEDPKCGAALLEQQLPILASDRNLYPGWLICPAPLRGKLQDQINDSRITLKNLSELSPDNRAKLLFEIGWRYKLTYAAIPSWLAQELFKICDPEKRCVLSSKQQMEIALLLLNNSRLANDEHTVALQKSTMEILEKNERHWPEIVVEIAFYKAIIARDSLNYSELEKLVFVIKCGDPIQKLRKASLLAELGLFDDVSELIDSSYRELLEQYSKDRNSIYVVSRLAWAQWLMRGIDTAGTASPSFDIPSFYIIWKCDPWDHIVHIRDGIARSWDQQQEDEEIEPSFEPGRYRNNSNSIRFSNDVHPFFVIDGISSTVGVPLRINYRTFFAEHLSKLIGLKYLDKLNCTNLAIRAASNDTSKCLKREFSRVKIACLSYGEIERLHRICIDVIDYWCLKSKKESGGYKRYSLGRLAIFIELLARISVRATPEQAKAIYRLAISIGKSPEFHCVQLMKPLTNLFNYSLTSIPSNQHHEILLESLTFPLSSEIQFSEYRSFPNPVIESPGCREHDSRIDRRIGEMIDGIAPCSLRSGPALLRLLPLLKEKFLTDDERRKIGEKIWGNPASYQAIPETGLFRSVLLDLPSADAERVKTLVRKYLFEAKGDDLFNVSLLRDVVGAARFVNEFPTHDQSCDYFNRLVSWRLTETIKVPFCISSEEEVAQYIGEVLSRSLTPSLPTEALSIENFDRLFSFYTDLNIPETLRGFIPFAVKNALLIDRVKKIIRLGLQDKVSNKVAHTAHALLLWRDSHDFPGAASLISSMIGLICSNRTVGLSALLWTANEMYIKSYLKRDDIESLAYSLPIIFDNSRYNDISYFDSKAINVSPVRAGCVRLARNILHKGDDNSDELVRISEEAKYDPLPEVRFVEEPQLNSSK